VPDLLSRLPSVNDLPFDPEPGPVCLSPDEEAQALIKRRKLELRLSGETLKRSLDSIVH